MSSINGQRPSEGDVVPISRNHDEAGRLIIDGKRNISEADVLHGSRDKDEKDYRYTTLLTRLGVGPGTRQYANAVEQAFIRMRETYRYLSFVTEEMRREINFRMATAAVSFGGDHFRLHINPEFFVFLGLKTNGRTVAWDDTQAREWGSTILAHECGHFMQRHIQRNAAIKEDDKEYYMVACELAVNSAFLNDRMLPSWALTVKNFRRKDHKNNVNNAMLPPGLTAEAYIPLLKKSRVVFPDDEGRLPANGAGGSGKPGDRDMPIEDWLEKRRKRLILILDGEGSPVDADGDFMDDHDQWTKKPGGMENLDQRIIDSLQATMAKNLMGKAHQRAMMAGCNPGNLQTYYDELMRGGDVPFADLIAGIVARHTATTKRTTFMRPGRRSEIPPGRRKGRKVKAKFYVDTSGSMCDEDVKAILSEAISAEAGGRGDVEIQMFDHGLQGKPVKASEFSRKPMRLGNGGTELTHVYKDIMESRPDIAFICTDGYVDIPKVDPRVPLAWVLTHSGAKPRLPANSIIVRLPAVAGEGADVEH